MSDVKAHQPSVSVAVVPVLKILEFPAKFGAEVRLNHEQAKHLANTIRNMAALIDNYETLSQNQRLLATMKRKLMIELAKGAGVLLAMIGLGFLFN